MQIKIKSFLVVVVIGILFLFGCQKEIDETIETPTGEVFTETSLVANLVQRTSLRDGSSDNIIDGTSCSSLVLPITVIVNGVELTIDSNEDFDAIEDILDESENDDDLVEILFPVTVVLSDHSEILLSSEEDLDDIIEDCTEGGGDDDIECVDFIYPLSISIFDSDKQTSDVITIKNDKEMHEFVHDLDENDIAGFAFPIMVLRSDGSEMVITNNHELEDVLESAIGDCDEDDDNDYKNDDEGSGNSDLFKELIEGEWIISYFFKDTDQTSDFDGYKFSFSADGTSLADNGANQIYGTWKGKNEDDGKQELELEFGETSLFLKIKDDWNVLEFDGTEIKLMDEDTVEESKRFLNFKRP